MRRPGEAPFEFLSVKLSDVTVTAVDPAVNGDNGESYEMVALDFVKVEVRYVARDAQGAPEAPIRFAWDIRSNKPMP